MTLGNLMWLVSAASLVGVIANIYHRRWCFWVWLVTNISWACYDFYIHAWAQGTLMSIYAMLAVWGLVQWKRSPK